MSTIKVVTTITLASGTIVTFEMEKSSSMCSLSTTSKTGNTDLPFDEYAEYALSAEDKAITRKFQQFLLNL